MSMNPEGIVFDGSDSSEMQAPLRMSVLTQKQAGSCQTNEKPSSLNGV